MELIKQITMRHGAPERAAQFILFGNKHLCKSYDSVLNEIYRLVSEAANEMRLNPQLDYYYCSTMGVVIFATYENPQYVHIDVLVDPCVGSQVEFDVLYEETA